ncbi:MAG TPA: hypothetical protein P5244_02635 [Syntrophales bacterium]|nr:hypothetical protein [Syntrophales bacterium]
MLTVILCVLCILIGAAGAYMLIDYGYRAGAALRNPAPVDLGAEFPRVAPSPIAPRDKVMFTKDDYNHMQRYGRATVYRPGR